MGYTTDFVGTFQLNKPLSESQALYLKGFAESRRMKRNADRLKNVSDPLRTAVGLPVGVEGGYLVGEHASIIDRNEPPEGQPGLWCNWTPTEDWSGMKWNDEEKFYYYVEWLQYIIDHFLRPWGYTLNGRVSFQGEDGDDVGEILVEDNEIVLKGGNQYDSD